MSFRGIFFDLYGTLLIYGDMRAAWFAWLSALYDQLLEVGLSMSKESFGEQCDGFFERPQPPAEDDGLTIYERRIRALGKAVGLDLADVVLEKAADASVGAWQQYVTLDPDAISVLGKLRSRKILGLVSNFEHPPHVYLLLSQLGLARLFDTVVISGEVGVEKPDPHIFELALEPSGLKPREVVYVGDTASDVQGALAAGLCPILIRRPGAGRQEIADFKLDENPLPEDVSFEGVETISALTQLVDLFGRKNVRRYGEEQTSD